VRVLFVCEHGSVKSPIAREHLRRLAQQRGLIVSVESRGIAPENAVSPTLAAALAADQIDTTREPIQRLSAADIDAADIVIVFNPLPAEFGARAVRDWTDTPSMNQDYAAARAALLPRLESFLNEIELRE
jgi:fructose-specific phosphotransferase system component IIB